MSNLAGSGCELLIPLSERKPLKDIERSIIKTYRKRIWTKFTKAVKDFKLVEEGDKIAVAISGGKDSLLMAKLFQELKRHGRISFELEFIAMDPGFHESNRKLLLSNCEYLNIPVKMFDSGIFEIVDRIANDYPCYMCARMRRGALYSQAQKLGCNKLALGHHFNDVIETTMLNILYAGNFKTMRPKLHATNFEGLELIRPMYYIHEDDIKRYTMNAGISPMNCGCVVAAQKTSSKRAEVKELIKKLKENFKDVEKSIFQSAQNVNIDSILGWEKGGKKYSFLDFYDEE
ncbi:MULTISPECIES: tRNA 2-thiocytidine biosynthesis TtcA family protein [Clostridium]|uniref:tRNA 2-thiocytidine biosynthesis protein TtcA n=2 Tax=Clostridium TaxID=1485 RepID=A0A151AMM3_9CLOT|nr:MULTISPECIES: ATP-binding protein [Clostridium]KYH28886.1 tRNA 2-thiocytidine biosynthesis protein TtcA [Clostridium colicanis DSM 13634]MBE6043293.1 tRNA 2-thiocytidine biosynthesis protein TtcA [Clostridium thermopalmarium]PRR73715.1 tRNA 2-thiocytidine biosynthesis protein TtcA [Clostridium thermopalmarium DSM 5974]PVZ21029.1 tRNA(Ile)-lysidine synthase TilS/MesJ [Clostridium thermopalmarium DSM 5974]